MVQTYTPSQRPPAGLHSGTSGFRKRKDVEVHLVRVPRTKRKIIEPTHSKGNWKIAYADFTTAMMAFFLLLWLVFALKPEQKVGLATYFDPQTMSTSLTSGSGGILGGRSIVIDGSMPEAYAPKTPANKLNMTQDEVRSPGTQAKNTTVAKQPDTPPATVQDKRIMNWLEGRWTQLRSPAMTEAEKRKISEQVEAAEFHKAADDLRQAIQNLPDHLQLERNLVIDQTPEGMRIQLVDQERTPMFATGSTELNDNAKRLLGLVVQAVKNLPHKVAITGHTDGNPYRNAATGYTNWDLSVGRANASRRILIEDGLDTGRISSVVGKADTEHLLNDDPLSPVNRRISFLLLRLRQDAPPLVVPDPAH